MPYKTSALYSILNNKCPRCHEGDFWKQSKPFKVMFIKDAEQMHETCSACDLKYEQEKGYWYGAMYASYAFGVAVFVTIWVATTILLPKGFNIWLQISIMLFFILGTSPISYYLSRPIWINIFIRYEGTAKEIKEKQKAIVK